MTSDPDRTDDARPPEAHLPRSTRTTQAQTGGERWLTLPAGPPLIEGSFTHDSLPDLFRFVCSRQQSLSWQLTTLAGTFTLTFEQGNPIDIIFNPTRPVGAKVGIKALRMLFQQEGGRFRLWPDPPAQERRTLHTSGEKLLIELATLDDEAVAPAVLGGITVNVDDELALVRDVPPPDHQTAFRTQASDVPLTEVLQLFSVSRQPYWVQLLSPQGAVIGRLHLNAHHEVVSAQYRTLSGAAGFSALLGHRDPGIIDVRPVQLHDQSAPTGSQTLGSLDTLLMRELLSGRLQGGTTGSAAGEAQAAAPAQTPGVGGPASPASPAPAAKAPQAGLLGRLLGRLRPRTP